MCVCACERGAAWPVSEGKAANTPKHILDTPLAANTLSSRDITAGYPFVYDTVQYRVAGTAVGENGQGEGEVGREQQRKEKSMRRAREEELGRRSRAGRVGQEEMGRKSNAGRDGQEDLSRELAREA